MKAVRVICGTLLVLAGFFGMAVGVEHSVWIVVLGAVVVTL
jgi:hypothetical protein